MIRAGRLGGGRGGTAGGGRRPVWRLVLLLVAVSAVIGVLAAGLLLPAAGVAAGTVYLGSSMVAPVSSESLNSVALPRTSVILDARGNVIAQLYSENRTEVPLSAMSPLIQNAIVAVEDSRFYEHGAIDPAGVVRAAIADRLGSSGSLQGASTLTQQYVKNLLLEQAVSSGNKQAARQAVARSVSRKLRELRLAESVEQDLTKQQILERYLNIVYFGEGSYGVQAAARRYFGTTAARLDLAQAATLAGLVQDPTGYSPVDNPQAARGRRGVVLADMRNQGLISPAQYEAAMREPMRVTGHPTPNGCLAAGTTGFFCQYVVDSILRDSSFSALGATTALRQKALLGGGLVIRTGLDPEAQAAAVRSLNSHVPPGDDSRLAAAAVTVVPGTGLVTTMAQDRTYSVAAGPSRTSINYATDQNLGGSSGFQTGSSFKPFTLAAWLDAGHGLGDTVDATKRDFPYSDFTACGKRLRGTPAYSPGNSEGTETGNMSVQQATANSVNVAYVDMETRLDICDIADLAGRLGVHLAVPARQCSDTGPASTRLPTCLPALTLGIEDVAPLTMAAAYAGFASGGTWCSPMPVRAITPGTGPDARPARPVVYPPRCSRALSPEVASGVNAALKEVLTKGTAAAVGPLPGHPSAGKTGTTDGPYDTWFVGYTAQRSTAVWVADPGRVVDGRQVRKRLVSVTIGGRYYSTVFGASVAAPIWKVLMATAMRGLPPVELP